MSTGPQPFDFPKLVELYGDETVRELLAMSVGEARGLIEDLDRGIQERDSKIVGAAAHQLKGLASTMFIHDLSTISLSIEGDMRQENWDSIIGRQAQLKQAFIEFEQYVDTINL